jgi:hypothetical protein
MSTRVFFGNQKILIEKVFVFNLISFIFFAYYNLKAELEFFESAYIFLMIFFYFSLFNKKDIMIRYAHEI